MRSCSRPGEYRATSRHLLSASAWGSGGLAAWVEGCASGLMWGGRAVGAVCALGRPGDPIVLLALEQRCPTAVRPLGHPGVPPLFHWRLCLGTRLARRRAGAWRRMRDSNSRGLAPNTLSNTVDLRAPGTGTVRELRECVLGGRW